MEDVAGLFVNYLKDNYLKSVAEPRGYADPTPKLEKEILLWACKKAVQGLGGTTMPSPRDLFLTSELKT